jgi:hypothetical protein
MKPSCDVCGSPDAFERSLCHAEPCCNGGRCDAGDGDAGLCVHCGAELTRIDDAWFHWTQFDDNRNLLPNAEPQSFYRKNTE